MKIKALITVAAMAIAVPALYAPAYAGEVRDDIKETGHDMKENTKSAGRSIKEESKEAMLTTKVKTALAAEKDLNSLKIHVDSENGGVVTLTGKVKTAAQSEQAANAAKSVEGVTDVRNKLEVRM